MKGKFVSFEDVSATIANVECVADAITMQPVAGKFPSGTEATRPTQTPGMFLI